MAVKFDGSILNSFGQPTGNWSKPLKAVVPQKMDSIDDFNKHFSNMICDAARLRSLEKSPAVDTLDKSKEGFTTIPSIFDNFLKRI